MVDGQERLSFCSGGHISPADRHDLLQMADLESCKSQMKQLEERTSSAGLWDDPQQAQKLMQELSDLRSKMKETEALQDLLTDVDTALPQLMQGQLRLHMWPGTLSYTIAYVHRRLPPQLPPP